MPIKNKLSVVLATYNEEANIGKCLAAVKNLADEIIIVDGSSTDKTREIATDHGAKVFKTANKPNFHINKQIAIDKAKNDWVLQLDADEIIPPKLAKEIQTTIEKNQTSDAYWIKRQNFFLGTFLKKGGQYPDPVIRLFKKGRAYLPQKDVHEQMVVKGELGTLENPMQHYTAPTFERYLTNANRYTSFTAAQLKKAKVKVNFFNSINYIIIKPTYTFLKLFVRHRGYVDGYPGFVFALFSGIHHSLAYLKYWEMVETNENSN